MYLLCCVIYSHTHIFSKKTNRKILKIMISVIFFYFCVTFSNTKTFCVTESFCEYQTFLMEPYSQIKTILGVLSSLVVYSIEHSLYKFMLNFLAFQLYSSEASATHSNQVFVHTSYTQYTATY